MGLINGNTEPITIIQYKYHESEYGKLLNGAFEDFTKDGENITICAKEESITVRRKPLVLFSPVLRSTLDTLTCCSKPVLILPDVSSVAVQHLWRILKYGETEFMGELNAAEIIVAAKCLQIDLTNFEYLKKARKTNVIPSRNALSKTSAPSMKSESDSDLDEDEVDDYGEDDEVDGMEIGNGLIGSTKLNSQMKSLLDEHVYDEQETLNEKPEDRNFLNRECSDPSSTRPTKGLQTCEVCHKNSRNLWFLWQHYCKSHFMKQIKTDCVQLANIQDMKCELCGEVFGSVQDLYLHVGIVHEKLNLVLVKHGYKPLVSPNSQSRKIAVEGVNYSVGENLTTSSEQKSKSPESMQVSAPVPEMHSSVSSQSFNYSLRPQIATYPMAPENWSNVPNDIQNKPTNRSVQPPLSLGPRYPQRYPAPPQYNPQQEAILSQVQIRPQQLGLWAQSGKPQLQGQVSTPTPPTPSALNTEVQRTLLTQNTNTSCQICQKNFPSVATISQHYVRAHFMADLKSDYVEMGNIHTKTCNACGSTFKSVDALFLHIGTVHQKVNEIMKKKGLNMLDMSLVRSRKSM